uniref:Uncharacterized protein n=1 Tax=Clytia hemisphaerica TaxID=252671 RepID=A0A7M5X1G5_9CNID
MEKHVKEAIDRLSDTASKASQVDAEMYKLKTWVDKKKHETIIEKKRQKAKARTKAYGGAAACTASGILAWLVCPIAYAVAVDVTEGKSIKEIEVLFGDAVRNMERMRNEIKLIGDKTKVIVSKVSENKESMISIRSQLDKTNRGGRMVVKRFKQSYLARFKKSLYDLYEKCKKYLESRNESTDPALMYFP